MNITATGDTRNEILQIAHVFKCAAVNVTDTTITLEITGETEKIDAIHRMLGPVRNSGNGANRERADRQG